MPGSKVAVLGMVIPRLIGNPYNGYINPYYWVDDHPLLYGNNGSLDPSTYVLVLSFKLFSFLPKNLGSPKTKLCSLVVGNPLYGSS